MVGQRDRVMQGGMDGGMEEWKDGGMEGWRDAGTDGGMQEWVEGCRDGQRVSGRRDRGVNGWLCDQLDRQRKGCTDRRQDRRTDGVRLSPC